MYTVLDLKTTMPRTIIQWQQQANDKTNNGLAIIALVISDNIM